MEINALKNEHAKEKETLVSELMLHKKHLEDMEHSLKLAEQQLQQSIRDRQVHREEVNAMTLELKKVKVGTILQFFLTKNEGRTPTGHSSREDGSLQVREIY